MRIETSGVAEFSKAMGQAAELALAEIERLRSEIARLDRQVSEASRLLREAHELYTQYGLVCNRPEGIPGYPAYEGSIDQGRWIGEVGEFLRGLEKKEGS